MAFWLMNAEARRTRRSRREAAQRTHNSKARSAFSALSAPPRYLTKILGYERRLVLNEERLSRSVAFWLMNAETRRSRREAAQRTHNSEATSAFSALSAPPRYLTKILGYERRLVLNEERLSQSVLVNERGGAEDAEVAAWGFSVRDPWRIDISVLSCLRVAYNDLTPPRSINTGFNT